jgi:hypothetical protein
LANLGAQSSERSSFLGSINRAISLVLFGLLLGVGWIALSYLKSGLHDHLQKSPAEQIIQNSNATALPVEVTNATTGVLVYAVLGDSSYYHTSGHLPSLRRRSAMSEEAARKRGLRPCPVCIRH